MRAVPFFDHSMVSDFRGESPSPLSVSMKPNSPFWEPEWG